MNTKLEQTRRLPSGSAQREMRCANVTAQVALAVVRLPRNTRALEPVLAAALSDIAGVSQVHVDSRRSVVQVLHDGRIDAAEQVHRLLVATGWAGTETAGLVTSHSMPSGYDRKPKGVDAI
ncbi:MAG: hypothetical protein PHR35_08490 [Kiritimatiellae bacterium]|nr:hypothetical protein [Kiritimatiellia bacterium]